MIRCSSQHGTWLCQGTEGHRGAHWADVGHRVAVFRWGMTGYGCPDPECLLRPGHPLPHRDGRGCSWVPIDADDHDLMYVGVPDTKEGE